MNNILDITNQINKNNLEKTEEEVIRKAKEDKNIFNKNKGFLDPREDHGLNFALADTAADGSITRRFIVDLIYLDPAADLDKSGQPRDTIADKSYCENDLKPNIEINGLCYPPFVCKTGNGLYSLDSGYNRAFCLESLFPGEKIPVFVLSDPYILDKNGFLQEVNNINQKNFLNIVSRIKTNPKNKSQNLSMTDVAQCIEQLYLADPTFGGLNPSSSHFKDFKDKPFNDVLDFYFPNYFPDPRPSRSKIFAMLWNQTSGQKGRIKPLTEQTKTGELIALGWDDGWSNEKKRRFSFSEHLDDKNNAYIAMTNTNGNNFESIVQSKLFSLFAKSGLSNKHNKIYVFCEVYKPEKSINKLNNQRNEFIKKIENYNEMASKYRIFENNALSKTVLPFVESVYFPKQLDNPSDTGKLYNLNKKTMKF